MRNQLESGFVVGGYNRARLAAKPEIRAEVERKYQNRLANASLMKRWRLRREIENEISKRIEKIAPPDALY